MVTESEILGRIWRVIQSVERLADLNEFVLLELFNAESKVGTDERGRDMVGRVALAMSEHSSGYISSEELMDHLCTIASNVSRLPPNNSSASSISIFVPPKLSGRSISGSSLAVPRLVRAYAPA